MERKLRVGQPITPEEFDALSDAQLERLVPRAQREFFPGKDACADCPFSARRTAVILQGGFLDTEHKRTPDLVRN